MSLRVLHLLDHSLPLHSGYTFRSAAIFREQRALGWSTFHLTTPRHGKWRSEGAAEASEDAEGWTFHRTPFTPGALSWLPGLGPYMDEMRATAARLDVLVSMLKPDVLHPHSPVLNALPALWVGRRRNLPVVYEMRASWEDAAVDHGSTREGSPRYRASRALETWALRRADAITTICEGLKGDIVARGIDAAQVTVIPNAVDAKAFAAGHPPDPELRTQLGLDGATVLGFAGSFYAYEGLDLLLEAAARLRVRHPDLKLLLLGGGPQESALKAQAARLGLSAAVIFTGRVPHSQVQKYYDLIDVLAYPRRSMRLTELVTPLKPLEAMAQGRLVVASDVGGHRELVRDGHTGFLFPAGDAEALATTIGTLLSNRERWPLVLAQARQYVDNERTWARSVARYAGVYRAVLSRTRGESAAAALVRS